MIRVLLDPLNQIAKIIASYGLHGDRLHARLLDSLYDYRLRTSLLYSLYDYRLRDRLRDRLHDDRLRRTGRLRTTRILPERHQPDARKRRDHQT
jgi:hypothetical protein